MNPNIDHNYWMRIVDDVSRASTCRVKLGCVLIQHNYIVGIGYVGSVSGDVHCNDEEVGCLLVDNYGKQGSGDGNKSCIRTVHAEMNAVLKCNTRGSEGSWLTCYSTYSPCLNCYKALLQIGVRHFYFKKDYKDDNRDLLMDNHSYQLRKLIIWEKI